MSAGGAVRAALEAALRAEPVLAGVGVHGSAQPAGELPRVELGEPGVTDWSAKDWSGREARTAVIVRVAAGQAGRLGALVGAVERAGAGLGGERDGWRVVGATLLRTRVLGEGAKGSAVLVEHRVRVVED